MLKELSKLPALTQSSNEPPKKKKAGAKKKASNLIKDFSVVNKKSLNPISTLNHIQQAVRGQKPEYTISEDHQTSTFTQFVVQASADDKSCTAVGPNKKVKYFYAKLLCVLHNIFCYRLLNKVLLKLFLLNWVIIITPILLLNPISKKINQRSPQ